jgi:hypothetical protein
MNRPAHPLIFLHLPKTAGTTLNAVLMRQFPRGQTYLLRSKNFAENLAVFKSTPEPLRHRIRLLHGHQSFGLHAFLAPGARYLAVLREPVARVISHYHYVKATEHPMFIDAIREGGMSLVDYAASSISGELENGQTRWIAGIWDDRTLQESDLDQAIENIEKHFAWLGLTEYFDESLIDLAMKYQWPRIYYRKKNVLDSARASPIPPQAIEAITERNRLDLKLYAYAKRRFDAVSPAHKAIRSAAAGLLGLANKAGSALHPADGG